MARQPMSGGRGPVPPENAAEWERARLANAYPPTSASPYPYQYPAPADSRGIAGVFSGLAFLAGVWLVLAPFALDYQNTGPGFNGRWNDIILGVAIALLALTRSFAPHRVVWMSWVNVVLGAWLIIAPFVLAYNAGADAPAAVANDVGVGILVVFLALMSSVTTKREHSRDQRQTDSPASPSERAS